MSLYADWLEILRVTVGGTKREWSWLNQRRKERRERKAHVDHQSMGGNMVIRQVIGEDVVQKRSPKK